MTGACDRGCMTHGKENQRQKDTVSLKITYNPQEYITQEPTSSLSPASEGFYSS